ncbi:CPBP family intramembrane glutamic endopeptidase [Alkalihalobacterium elongatum]|uniref:CPBP family intramembrane glutamic endopeptidase n=1 Tax=Alkalihalobacterium elongatum TaxID=2675466 RepID=UPI001C20079E|nr:type II CAAX endopeptidase family protein [Alkalihalobacterium elongatum]
MMQILKLILGGLIVAHFLLWLSFAWQPLPFWVLFPFALLILIGIAILFVPIKLQPVSFSDYLLGLGTGFGLYILFALGKNLIEWLNLPFIEQLHSLYALVQPVEWWHYLMLFLIVIPGEELFWRGFVFQKVNEYVSPILAIIISSVLYASAHIYAGTFLLLVAALIAGPVWAYLYYRTQNINIAILSHSIFNLFLLVLLPLL